MGRVERRCPVGSTPIVCRHIYGVFNVQLFCSIPSVPMNPLPEQPPAKISFYLLVEYADKWPPKFKVEDLNLSAALRLRLSESLSPVWVQDFNSYDGLKRVNTHGCFMSIPVPKRSIGPI